MRDRSVLSGSPSGALSECESKRRYPLVLTGGFPCQDLSIAGRQAGLRGERSGLWIEFSRSIRAIRPDWVVIENVAHTWRRWVPDVREHLSRDGYSSLPIQVRASDLGACHQRARIFLVAHADCELLRELSRWWLGPGREMAKELGESWDSTPRGLGKDDGLPFDVDRRRALGNAIVPHIAHLIAEGIKQVTD